MNKLPWRKISLVLTGLFTIFAILTLVPFDKASKICPLGYKAVCTFTPYSTIILVVLAGIICFLRVIAGRNNKIK
jgi:hypothetical protein